MRIRRARLLTGQKGGADLCRLGAKRQCATKAVAVSNSARRYNRCSDLAGNDLRQRECAEQRVFGAGQKGGTVATGFETGGDDQIHTGCVQRFGLGDGGGCACRQNTTPFALGENLGRGDAKDEGKDRWAALPARPRLVLRSGGDRAPAVRASPGRVR